MYPSSTSAMDACFLKEMQTVKKKEYYSDSDDFDLGISTFRTSDNYLEEHHIRDASALEKSDSEDEVFSDHEQVVLFPLRPPPRLQNALCITSSSSLSHRPMRSSPASFRYGLSLGFGLIKSKKNKDFDPFMAALERVQKEAEETEKEHLPSSRTRSFSSSFRLIPEPAKVVPQIKASKEDDCSQYWDEFRIEVGVRDDQEICSFSDGEARPLKPPQQRLQPGANYGRFKSSSFRRYSGLFLGKIKYSRSTGETEVQDDPFAVALERVRKEAGKKNDPEQRSTASARTGLVRRARSFRWGTEPAASNAASARKKKEMGSVINDQSPVNGGTSSIYCAWHVGKRGSGADHEHTRLHKRKDVGRRGFGYLLIQFHGFLR